jgi:hypothetical protein
MNIAYFSTGGFVAHKYRIGGLKSKFSVWFNIDGFAIDAERIDARGRSFPVDKNSAVWRYIERHKLAGLDSAAAIAKARDGVSIAA